MKVIRTTAKVWLRGKVVPFGTRLRIGEDCTEAEARQISLYQAAVPDGEADAASEPSGSAPSDPPSEDELEALRLRVDEAIRTMAPKGYGKDGKPDVRAIQSALPDDKARIDAALRDAVWGRMVEGGFKAPTTT